MEHNMTTDMQTEVVVLGAGPGGYTAAFRAADLGKKVVLIERYENLGGVCLNVGCIPSKALLHAAKVLDEAKSFSEHGIQFGSPTIDLDQLRNWKEGVIKRLTSGLQALAKQRKVTVIEGTGSFSSPTTLLIKTKTGEQTLNFEHAIIAVGSRPVALPFLPKDPRVIDSTGALALAEIPKRLLIMGGGIIGMEMAAVYDALGSEVTVVELMDTLLAGADKDLVTPLQKRVQKKYKNILLSTKVVAVEAKPDGLWVSFEGKNAPTAPECFDYVLSAVGRAPNGQLITAEKAGVFIDERGFIPSDKQQRTNVPHIFAVGDVTSNPMLAHKAIPQARVAAEVIAGKKHFFDPLCIPSVAYTDPEVAWVGLTESEAKANHVAYEKGVFPWMANGRSLSLGRDEGLTKIIFDKETHRILGAGIVGPNAGDLIAEVGLAIEMGCDATDIALTIHPHPTLSETIALATEVFEGTVTDLYLPKK
jgi:dihydrolipoamide dehydrogenase